MAWTDLTFVECSVLTAAKMTQLQGNFAALAAGDSGAPPLAIDGVSSLALVHASSGLVAPQVSSLGVLVLGAGPAGTPAANALYPENVPKAWVNFDGSSVTATNDLTGVRDCFNVSGVVDLGVGNYYVYFDRDFSDGNYCSVGDSDQYTESIGDSPLAGRQQISTRNISFALADAAWVHLLVIGRQS
jgi:hypothetical protein